MAVGFPNQGFSKYPDPTTQVVDAIFKEFYLPGVQDLLNSKRVLLRYMRRNSKNVSGEFASMSLNTGRNEGIGFIGETGLLPDPGKQQYDKAYYRMRYYYGRILFTGPAVASSRSERGAFINILDGEIRGLSRDMMHEANRVAFGDGTGRLATVSGTSGTSVFVQNPGGFSNTGPGTQYLRPGMRVMLVDPAGPTYRTIGAGLLRAYKIGTVDGSTGAIEIVDASGTPVLPTGTVANDIIVRASESSATVGIELDSGYLNEPFGLAAIVDEGNPASGQLGGIDATSTAVWNAQVIDNGGVPIPFNQNMLEQAHDLLDVAADGHLNLWMTTHNVRRQYLATLVPQKEYVNTMDLDGGWKALEYNGQPLVVDKDCTYGRIYGLDLSTIYLFDETDYFWIDSDGSVLHRLPNTDAFQAVLARYYSHGTNARNRHVVIKDIMN